MATAITSDQLLPNGLARLASAFRIRFGPYHDQNPVIVNTSTAEPITVV